MGRSERPRWQTLRLLGTPRHYQSTLSQWVTGLRDVFGALFSGQQLIGLTGEDAEEKG